MCFSGLELRSLDLVASTLTCPSHLTSPVVNIFLTNNIYFIISKPGVFFRNCFILFYWLPRFHCSEDTNPHLSPSFRGWSFSLTLISYGFHIFFTNLSKFSCVLIYWEFCLLNRTRDGILSKCNLCIVILDLTTCYNLESSGKGGSVRDSLMLGRDCEG